MNLDPEREAPMPRLSLEPAVGHRLRSAVLHAWRHRALRGLAVGFPALLLLAACAGSPASSGGQAGPPTRSAASSQSPFQAALAYAQCMRVNGVAKFPDPVNKPGGGFGMDVGGPGSAIDPTSPSFQAAERACQHLMPGDVVPGGATTSPQQALAWAACIRAHGEPNFPDPQVSNGTVQFQLYGTGVSPNAPAFRSAEQACLSVMPPDITMRNTRRAPGGGQP